MKFYFTFGFGQANENCFTVIEATNREAAREEMNRRHGRQWAFCYDSAEEAGVERFGLKEIH